jgi:ferric-dicitrate binding protein FerR (iron transport regulator)
MKSSLASTAPRLDADDSQPPRNGRRRLVVGAGVAAGAAALAAAALQRHQPETPSPVAAAEGGSDPAQGYRLTDHIRRYYETTRS